MTHRAYIGRFAPSPTGNLHFGSLVTAVASYLQARAHRGRWLIRIEDIDPDREIPGSAEAIVSDLLRLNLIPDEPVTYQSQLLDDHERAWQSLVKTGLAYPCRCTRKMLPQSGIYPGTCKSLNLSVRMHHRIRLVASSKMIDVDDRIMGHSQHCVASETGDFLIRRADGWPAYHLAVVVDDHKQKITEVVRGTDLLDSTARQINLQRTLGMSSPQYFHIPTVVTADGKKLSKREQSDGGIFHDPGRALKTALSFLGQPPVPRNTPTDRILPHAIENWDPDKIPRHREAVVPSYV